MLVNGGAPAGTERQPALVTGVFDVLEEGETEPEQLANGAVRARTSQLRVAQHLSDAALEELVLVAVVLVEGGAPDVGATEDLLHDDVVVWFLVHERRESAVQ